MRLITILFLALHLIAAPAAFAAEAPVKEEVSAVQLYKGDLTAQKSWFIPPETDISIKMIGAVLGGDPAGAVVLPILGDMMLIYNLICLALGTLIFSLTSVMGMLKTATEGEFLGKKWSSAMVPMRFALSTALLVPMASGFSVGQYFALGAVYGGVGVADTIWSVGAKSAVERQGEYQGTIQQGNVRIRGLMVEIMNAEACLRGYRDYYADMGNDGMVFARSPIINDTITWGGTPKVAGAPGYENYADICGSVKLPLISQNESANIAGAGGMGHSGALDDLTTTTSSGAGAVVASAVKGVTPGALGGVALGATMATAIYNIGGAALETHSTLGKAIRGQQIKQVEVAAQQMEKYVAGLKFPKRYDTGPLLPPVDSMNSAAAAPVAAVPVSGPSRTWVPPNRADMEKEIQTAATNYQINVGAAVSKAMNADASYKKMLSSVTDSAQFHGWILSGAWHYQIAKLSSETSRLLNWAPTFTAGGTTVAQEAEKDGGYRFAETMRDLDFGRVKSPEGVVQILTSLVMDHLLQGYFGNLSSKTVMSAGYIFGYDPGSFQHPLVQLQTSGQGLLDTIIMIDMAMANADALGAALKAAGSAVGLSNVIPGGAGLSAGAGAYISSLISRFTGMIGYACAILLGVAIFKAFILPLLVMFKFLKQALAFIISVAELILAIPIMTAYLAHPEGDDLSSEKAKVGFGMILEVCLRPTLLVFSLVLAYLIMVPAVMLAHSLYAITVGTVLSSFGLSTIIGIVVMAVVYAVVIFVTVDKCADVVDVLPSRVMGYVSLRGHDSHGEGLDAAIVASTKNVQQGVKNGIALKGGKGAGAEGTAGGEAAAKAGASPVKFDDIAGMR